jgi:hypothetical protein
MGVKFLGTLSGRGESAAADPTGRVLRSIELWMPRLSRARQPQVRLDHFFLNRTR